MAGSCDWLSMVDARYGAAMERARAGTTSGRRAAAARARDRRMARRLPAAPAGRRARATSRRGQRERLRRAVGRDAVPDTAGVGAADECAAPGRPRAGNAAVRAAGGADAGAPPRPPRQRGGSSWSSRGRPTLRTPRASAAGARRGRLLPAARTASTLATRPRSRRATRSRRARSPEVVELPGQRQGARAARAPVALWSSAPPRRRRRLPRRRASRAVGREGEKRLQRPGI